MKNNVFWLLFGSTAIGLSICGLALYLSILFAMEQDQVLDFANDIQMIRAEIEENCALTKQVTELEECIAEHDGIYGFILQLTKDKSQQELKQLTHEKIGVVGDKIIHEYVDGEHQEKGYLASAPLNIKHLGDDLWLMVRDDFEQYEDIEYVSDEESTNDEDGLDIALTGAIYGIFILLCILALFLYFPVRKLNRWIGDIQHASEQIGKQNYEVRLTEYKTQPLGNLASSFNGMAEKIQDHIRDKNVLANAIAHELRTPLTRFRLALGLLQRQPLEGLSKELVSDLERYTDDLEMITDNTLRLATLRDSKINLQMIKLEEFIQNEVEKFRSSFPKLTLSCESQICELNTDIGFLQLAIDNLLSNACHYAKGKVSLKQWNEDDQAIIEVCDDGPGIQEKDIEYIQLAFTRLDESRNRGTGGTGLGLAIVRIAVQRLEGELSFQSAEPGTRIRLCLPLRRKAVN